MSNMKMRVLGCSGIDLQGDIGQALLTSFMRSLHHLTARRQTCTIVINAVVGGILSSESL